MIKKVLFASTLSVALTFGAEDTPTHLLSSAPAASSWGVLNNTPDKQAGASCLNLLLQEASGPGLTLIPHKPFERNLAFYYKAPPMSELLSTTAPGFATPDFKVILDDEALNGGVFQKIKLKKLKAKRSPVLLLCDSRAERKLVAQVADRLRKEFKHYILCKSSQELEALARKFYSTRATVKAFHLNVERKGPISHRGYDLEEISLFPSLAEEKAPRSSKGKKQPMKPISFFRELKRISY